MISCKEYAQIRKEELKEKVSAFSRKPCLCIIQIGNNAASNSYIKGKLSDCKEINVDTIHIHIDEEEKTQEELKKMIKDINNDKEIDGIIIQLPIPNKYNVEELQKYISPKKDVDGFRRDSCFEPCTPKGVMNWLEYNNYDVEGKDVIIIGRSKIVGKPLVNMFIDKGATVTCCNSKTKNLKNKTMMADLVVSAIGKAKYLDKSYFNYPEIIIDVGINRDDNGKLCGDVNKEDVEEKCKNTYITPVPGSVGLLTRCSLLENTIKAYEMNVYYK